MEDQRSIRLDKNKAECDYSEILSPWMGVSWRMKVAIISGNRQDGLGTGFHMGCLRPSDSYN